jgi:hypothetical protein
MNRQQNQQEKKDAILAHLDPFSHRFNPPKIEDGKCAMSSAVKLRMTGQVTMPTTSGSSVVLCLGPGLSSNFYAHNGLPVLAYDQPVYQAHFATPALRDTIKLIRLVGAAVKFSLLNNADQNEGYWEAVRVPFNWNDLTVRAGTVGTDPITGSLDFSGAITSAGTDFSQHSSYQTGKLKDLYKYQFKLNSLTTEHPFTDPTPIGSPVGTTITPAVQQGFIDESFDIVLIRVYGRNEATLPSVIRYEVVSNQEVVWKENSQTARLMTRSTHNMEMNSYFARTNYEMPGVKVSN